MTESRDIDSKPTNEDACPFRVCDTNLYLGTRQLELWTASLTQLLSATQTSLTFTDQKNAVQDQAAAHSQTNELDWNPV